MGDWGERSGAEDRSSDRRRGGGRGETADTAMAASGGAVAGGGMAVAARLMLRAVILVVWETVLAKMRLFRVPQFLGFAFMLSLLAMLTHVVLETGG